MKTQRGALIVKAEDGTEKVFFIDVGTAMPSGTLPVGTRVSVRFQPLDASRSRAMDVTIVNPATASIGQVG